MADSLADVKSIFGDALELRSPAERAAYLDQACGGDPRLRAEVESLLRARQDAGCFLASPGSAAGAAAEEPFSERAGTVLGPYKLLEQIGEGGFGVVFLAEQKEPLRRKVALKVLKPGMDSRQVVARFEAERQALALMDHPNIARVFDGGQTPPAYAGGSPRPYFVMELVKGVPITEFCDQNGLTPRERLELFLSVCQAVQHAHQKGVIHRDLKPANVLVSRHDTTPVVKVIDFGVAKALGRELTDKTVFTGLAQLIGTPLYMSPEQAGLSDLDIDTRSDIYALGVLLYELLTGTTPFAKERFSQAGYDELRRIIRVEEPPRPSTRISTLGPAAVTVSTKRKSDPKQLSRLLCGELDWIVMKALEKDRTRRYQTANGFARDIERYLKDEPVEACPPSAAYRLRKFARKHRRLLATAGAFLGLLVLGVIGLGVGLVTVHGEQQKTQAALGAERTAKTQARQALDALTDDVVETLFAQQPELGKTENAFLRQVLASYEAITQELGETAEARFLRARGYYKVARLRNLLGEPDEAGWRRAVALLEQLAAEFPDVPEYRQTLARSQDLLGIELAELGKRAEAERALRRARDLLGRLAGDFPKGAVYRRDLAGSTNDLANVLRLQRKYADAEAAYRQAVNLNDQLATASPTYRPALARNRSSLADLLRQRGQYAEAEELYRQALSVQEKRVAEFPAVPRGRRELADSYQGLGIVLAELRQPEEAETALRQALGLRKKLADDFPKISLYRRDLAAADSDRGTVLRRLGKYPEAEAAYRQAIALREKLVAEAGARPRHHQELARSYSNLGIVLAELRKPEEAETALRQALSHQAKLADSFPEQAEYRLDLATTRSRLGNLFRLQRRPDQALPWYHEALVLLQPLHQQQPEDAATRDLLFRTHWGRAQVLHALKRAAEALADWDRAVELAPPGERLAVQLGRAQAFARAGKVAEAVADAEVLTRDAATPSARCCEAACVFSLASAAAQEVGQREAYAGQALALLRRAQAAGFFLDRAKVERLQRDTDLEPLRSRGDFQGFVAELLAAARKE
jgi:serine/threonine protein kinase/Flp pilus assembly protein TadD